MLAEMDLHPDVETLKLDESQAGAAHCPLK